MIRYDKRKFYAIAKKRMQQGFSGSAIFVDKPEEFTE